MSKRRAALHAVMEQLETEVEAGNVNEGAHLRLCKRLKRAYDAPSCRMEHIRSYLIDVLKSDPISAASVPMKYRYFTLELPAFLAALFRAKRTELNKDSGTDDYKEIPASWWEEFLMGAAPEWMFANMNDRDFLLNARAFLGILIATDDDSLCHVEAHLDRLKVKPSALFPVAAPDADSGREDLGVSHMLDADPRFVRWLLKDEAYTEDEREQLRAQAFDFSTPDVHDDAGWREALGLRNIDEVRSCVAVCALGSTFREARERVIAQRQPRTP